MAAFPRLTELTVLCPHPHYSRVTATVTGIPFDVVEVTRSITLELVDACKALPDFDTFQIVHFLPSTAPPSILDRCVISSLRLPPVERQNRALKERVNDLKARAKDRLREPNTGCQEGEGRRRTTLRVIGLSVCDSPAGSHLDPLTIEEYEA